MSRCHPVYTKNFVWLSKREQRAFTEAMVELALKSKLTAAERKTLDLFEQRWLTGRDFHMAGTLKFFVDICRQHGVAITFKRKPKLKKPKPGEGGLFETTYVRPDDNGSYWPKWKEGQTAEERNQIKAAYRVKVMLDHMKKLGVPRLDYKLDQTREAIERVVVETMEKTRPTPISTSPVRAPMSKPTPTNDDERLLPYDWFNTNFGEA